MNGLNNLKRNNMKAQLVKRQDRFDLYNESDGSKIASTLPNPMGKLSIANCEAIANGYDLDELACNEIGIDISVINHIDNKVIENDSVSTPIHEAGALGAGLYHRVKGFEIGFQKAIELLGDKKYTEIELYRAFLINSAGNNTTLENTFKETVLPLFIDNEWDVEIEMEPYVVGGNEDFVGDGETHIIETKLRPQLDADGCLILKRK